MPKPIVLTPVPMPAARATAGGTRFLMADDFVPRRVSAVAEDAAANAVALSRAELDQPSRRVIAASFVFVPKTWRGRPSLLSGLLMALRMNVRASGSETSPREDAIGSRRAHHQRRASARCRGSQGHRTSPERSSAASL